MGDALDRADDGGVGHGMVSAFRVFAEMGE
jgi:hypothetical protein